MPRKFRGRLRGREGYWDFVYVKRRRLVEIPVCTHCKEEFDDSEMERHYYHEHADLDR